MESSRQAEAAASGVMTVEAPADLSECSDEDPEALAALCDTLTPPAAVATDLEGDHSHNEEESEHEDESKVGEEEEGGTLDYQPATEEDGASVAGHDLEDGNDEPFTEEAEEEAAVAGSESGEDDAAADESDAE